MYLLLALAASWISAFTGTVTAYSLAPQIATAFSRRGRLADQSYETVSGSPAGYLPIGSAQPPVVTLLERDDLLEKGHGFTFINR